jgi:hypothetical protein
MNRTFAAGFHAHPLSAFNGRLQLVRSDDLHSNRLSRFPDASGRYPGRQTAKAFRSLSLADHKLRIARDSYNHSQRPCNHSNPTESILKTQQLRWLLSTYQNSWTAYSRLSIRPKAKTDGQTLPKNRLISVEVPKKVCSSARLEQAGITTRAGHPPAFDQCVPAGV